MSDLDEFFAAADAVEMAHGEHVRNRYVGYGLAQIAEVINAKSQLENVHFEAALRKDLTIPSMQAAVFLATLVNANMAELGADVGCAIEDAFTMKPELYTKPRRVSLEEFSFSMRTEREEGGRVAVTLVYPEEFHNVGPKQKVSVITSQDMLGSQSGLWTYGNLTHIIEASLRRLCSVYDVRWGELESAHLKLGLPDALSVLAKRRESIFTAQ